MTPKLEPVSSNLADPQFQSIVQKPIHLGGYSGRDSTLFYRWAKPILFSLPSGPDEDCIWEGDDGKLAHGQRGGCYVNKSHDRYTD